MPNTINFYEVGKPWGEFSNFYIRSIVIQDILDKTETTWPSTEHYFQAMKSEDPEVQEHVRTKIATPGEAKRYCTYEIKLREDWETPVQITDKLREVFRDDQGLIVDRVKDHIMYSALQAKFLQHLDLAKLLLSTGDAYLVEHTSRDSYWGDGAGRASGLNKLGRMLVLVRTHLERNLAQQLVSPG